MTTNHPAHGPVSLERLHQIRQYIERNNQYQNGGNMAYILADMLKVIDEVLEARNVEPVFFIEVDGDDWIQAGRIPGSTFDFNNLPDGVNKLWAAPQPASVVPDEKTDNDYVTDCHGVPSQEDCAHQRGWNDCRAAMLNGDKS